MKLYTEEQSSNSGKDTADYIDKHIVQAMVEVAKEIIELPSDEEIEEYLQKTHTKAVNPLNVYYRTGFESGAKWIKEQILNQNK